MTPSLSRSEINRSNAQHSTGPKTGEGKKRSSLNAMRHGLTAQVLILPAEELARYKSLCQSVRNQHQPKTDEEERLVQLLADTQWRIDSVPALAINLQVVGLTKRRRYRDAEDDDIGMALANAVESREQIKAQNNLSLLEQRLWRQQKNLLAEIERVQTERRAHETQQAQPPKTEPLPAASGFVFSSPLLNPDSACNRVEPTPPSPAASPDPPPTLRPDQRPSALISG